MTEVFKYALIPILSTFIGWATNRIAIRNLFHPREPDPIFGIQGAVPKNIERLSEKIAEEIDGKVIVVDEITDTLIRRMKSMFPLLEVVEEKHTDRIKDIINRNVDIKDHVQSKLKTIDIGEFEKIVMSVASKEFRRIEIVGAVIGFLVGLWNMAILLIV